MATKTINGSYPGGYYLNPSFQTLDVANGAFVGGPGITASSTQPSTINNSGTVHGGTNGITLNDGGTVTNDAGHYIGGCINISGQAGTVTNNGTLGPSFNGYSVILQAGGTVTNGSASNTGATIDFGIQMPGGYGKLTNFGSIYFVFIRDNSFVANYGSIAGLSLSGVATVINGNAKNSTATISHPAAVLQEAGSVTNFGVINGFGGTAIRFYSSNSRLIEEGTGSIFGNVLGDGGALEFGNQGGEGTTNGIGTTLSGFSTVQFDGGSRWTLGGATSVAAGTIFTNNGTLADNNATFTNNGTVSNTRFLDLAFAAHITNDGSMFNRAGGTMTFQFGASIAPDQTVNAGAFYNAGLIKMTGNSASDGVINTGNAPLIDTGVLDIENGTLGLEGQSVTIAGLVKGAAGTIALGSGTSSVTIGSGASIATKGLTTAGHVTIARQLGFAGDFSAANELTINSGDLLQLKGATIFSQAMIDGTGELRTQAKTTITATTLGGAVVWKNFGDIGTKAQNELTGEFTIGDLNGVGAKFMNMVGAEFDLTGTSGIAGTAPKSTFVNAGLLAKISGNTANPSSIAAMLENVGTVEIRMGGLDLGGAVTNTGTLQIDSGTVLQADAAVGAGQTVLFEGTGDRLVLTSATDFQARLSGFGGSDKMDLTQFGQGSTIAYAGSAAQGTLTVTDGALQAKIALLGQYAAAGFSIGTDGHGGSLITYTPPPSPTVVADHLSTPNA